MSFDAESRPPPPATTPLLLMPSLLGDMTLDREAFLGAVSDDTVLMVGSAPSYPTGRLGPIRELAAVAAELEIPFHVDACLGGFFLPFAERAGRTKMPDFRIPGVTTISADFHKFGYASTKGVSVILHRDDTTYEHQVFHSRVGTGPVRYETEGMLSSRSAVPIAAAWAVLQLLGEEGFNRRTVETLAMIDAVTAGITAIPHLHVLGEPGIPHISYASDSVDIFALARGLADRPWAMHQDEYPSSAVCGPAA
jgi:glutamate/tyrosine decarboxylase-like PLP-dependent enzyme